MTIRKAILPDLDAVEKLYEEVHDAEESGRQTIGRIRGVYPVRSTAEAVGPRLKPGCAEGSSIRSRSMSTLSGTGSIPRRRMRCAYCTLW